VDLMKALICGASNTPYAHGCYEYDIFCDNNYPRDPPKMNLITTGSGSVRFNPNLYACGKVCLSLLGTWRGSATENWDPKLSTILQVLLSTQAIIMSEEVYFNEPGFENEAGTPEGEKKNEGYQNIVRYCNIKFAMLGQLKKPSKGFESVIKRHFYIKKEEILKEVKHWLDLAEKHEAAYTGLVNDHNYNWANQFKASKTKYKEMLAAAITELEDELNKLERPSDYELQLQQELKKKQQQQAKKAKKLAITEGKADLNDIDMDSDQEGEETSQINTESGKKKEEGIDIEDEAVKDRWSRYIGAMGVEAVAKQSAANIFLSGAGALGIEIAKNLVLAGCKSFTLHDYKPITYRDLSGQFFLNLEEDLLNEKKKKATRGEACIHRLKQLNYYVKC
jgi:ubiquitin-protein ligase